MDYRQLFSDDTVRQEFLDRFDEIADGAGSLQGFESISGSLNTSQAAKAVRQMSEGTWKSEGSGLEAIIERFTRPVHLVQGSTFVLPDDGFVTSAEISKRLDRARGRLESAIPSIGRIDLRNHRHAWVGTGWMVAPDLVATNRHVAKEFASESAQGFAFQSYLGQRIHATLDWFHEYERAQESRFAVREVVWMEPASSTFDVALLRINATGEEGQPAPPAIVLDTGAIATGANVGRWIAVIGYPALDSRANRADQQRIFDGIFNYKRLAAGRLTAVESRGIVSHDATTLGGNSGSAVIDLATGTAVALHFGGLAGSNNYAVSAAVLNRLVAAHDH